MSLHHTRGLVLAELLHEPLTAVQVSERLRQQGVRWPARGDYCQPTYERVMSSLVALEPQWCRRVPLEGERGYAWELTERGTERALAAVVEEDGVDAAAPSVSSTAWTSGSGSWPPSRAAQMRSRRSTRLAPRSPQRPRRPSDERRGH